MTAEAVQAPPPGERPMEADDNERLANLSDVELAERIAAQEAGVAPIDRQLAHFVREGDVDLDDPHSLMDERTQIMTAVIGRAVDAAQNDDERDQARQIVHYLHNDLLRPRVDNEAERMDHWRTLLELSNLYAEAGRRHVPINGTGLETPSGREPTPPVEEALPPFGGDAEPRPEDTQPVVRRRRTRRRTPEDTIPLNRGGRNPDGEAARDDLELLPTPENRDFLQQQEVVAAMLAREMRNPFYRRTRRSGQSYAQESQLWRQLAAEQIQTRLAQYEQNTGELLDPEAQAEQAALMAIEYRNHLNRAVTQNLAESKTGKISQLLDSPKLSRRLLKTFLAGATVTVAGAGIAAATAVAAPGVGAVVASTVLVASARYGLSSVRRMARNIRQRNQDTLTADDPKNIDVRVMQQQAAAGSYEGALERGLRTIENQTEKYQDRARLSLLGRATLTLMPTSIALLGEYAPDIKDYAVQLAGAAGRFTKQALQPGWDWPWHKVDAPGTVPPAPGPSTGLAEQIGEVANGTDNRPDILDAPQPPDQKPSILDAPQPLPNDITPPIEILPPPSPEVLSGIPDSYEVPAYDRSTGEGTLSVLAAHVAEAGGLDAHDGALSEDIMQHIMADNPQIDPTTRWLDRGDQLDLTNVKAYVAGKAQGQ